MSTATYTVVGMTCGHCVTSVTEEVAQVPGVTNVDVELVTGGLTVTSDGGVEDAAVHAAVEDAGYEVAARSGQASPAGGQPSGCGCGCS